MNIKIDFPRNINVSLLENILNNSIYHTLKEKCCMLKSSTTEKYSIRVFAHSRESFEKTRMQRNFFSLPREIYPKLTVNITVYSDMLKALSLKIRKNKDDPYHHC